MDLALNSQQCLICHKTKLKPGYYIYMRERERPHAGKEDSLD